MHRSSSLLVTLLLGCTSPDPATPREPASPSATKVEAEPNSVSEGDEYFFAVLGQSGVEHCPAGRSDSMWRNVQPTLGFVAASGPAAEILEPLMDQPVLARGTRMAAPPADRVSAQECPMMQMRSDWVNTPRGIRARRTDSPSIEHFHITSVRRLDELVVERVDDIVSVSLRNELPFDLEDVQLVMHYEGCYGKPGTTSIASAVSDLRPSTSFSHDFPLMVEREAVDPRTGGPNALEHRAADLVLSFGEPVEGVHADLTVSLSAFGIEFECP